MALGQIVALVMVNKCVKFHNISFSNKEVMTKVKVLDDNDYNYYYADADARVMTIPRLFCPKTDELKIQTVCLGYYWRGKILTKQAKSSDGRTRTLLPQKHRKAISRKNTS